jgi:hypothetical protein
MVALVRTVQSSQCIRAELVHRSLFIMERVYLAGIVPTMYRAFGERVAPNIYCDALPIQ